jgi:hypothetical protein
MPSFFFPSFLLDYLIEENKSRRQVSSLISWCTLVYASVTIITILGARDSSVGIAASYELDGPGIESRWGRDFSALVQTGPVAHPVSYIYNRYRVFPGDKAAGTWR